MIELGASAKDKITGFSGVVTGFCQYITGCNQALLCPKGKGGKFEEPRWFDEQRLDVIKGKKVVLDNSKTPGFDKPAPVR